MSWGVVAVTSAPKPALATLMIIHPPDVDLRGASGTRQLQRTYQIFCVDAGTLRKIVGCPQWQDAKRRLRAYISPDQGIDHGVQGAVAATGHYPLGTVLDGLPDEPSQILPAPRNINIYLDARLSDMLYCRLDLGLGARLLM